MHEDATRNVDEIAELLVSEATPSLRKRQPIFEATTDLGCGLHTPASSAVLEEHVFGQRLPVHLLLLLQVEQVLLPRAETRKLHDLPRRVHLLALRQRLLHNHPRREPARPC